MKYKNNPFNIRYNGQSWIGLSGHKNGFCEFISLDYGIRAWLILMRTYRRNHNICTIRKIVKRFAPPSENDTFKYIDFVSKYCFIPSDRYLNFETQYYMIGRAMALNETNTSFSLSQFSVVADKFNIHIVS